MNAQEIIKKIASLDKIENVNQRYTHLYKILSTTKSKSHATMSERASKILQDFGYELDAEQMLKISDYVTKHDKGEKNGIYLSRFCFLWILDYLSTDDLLYKNGRMRELKTDDLVYYAYRITSYIINNNKFSCKIPRNYFLTNGAKKDWKKTTGTTPNSILLAKMNELLEKIGVIKINRKQKTANQYELGGENPFFHHQQYQKFIENKVENVQKFVRAEELENALNSMEEMRQTIINLQAQLERQPQNDTENDTEKDTIIKNLSKELDNEREKSAKLLRLLNDLQREKQYA